MRKGGNSEMSEKGKELIAQINIDTDELVERLKKIICNELVKAELEEIKAELLSYEADCQITADTQTCMKCTADTFKSIEQILDNHIKELNNGL